MNQEQKTQLLERLIKDGSITFTEAILLMDTDKETAYVPGPIQYVPMCQPAPYNPWSSFYGPFQITFDAGSTLTTHSPMSLSPDGITTHTVYSN